MTAPEGAERRAELDRLHRRAEVRRHRSLVLHWAARWLRRPAKPAVWPRPQVEPGQVGVTFGGHASAVIRYADLAVAFDPMMGRWCGAVRRAVDTGLVPDDLEDARLVLVSHAHRDHLHLPTLARVSRRATVVTPPGAARLVSGLGFARVVELGPGADLDVGGVQVHAAAAAHGDAPLARSLVYLVRGDGPSVLLCGDGAWSPVFAEIGRRAPPDLALLPIGGYWPAGFRARHMSPADALAAFEDLRARLMIPIHHGAFSLSYERLDEPLRWLEELVRQRRIEPHVRALEPGESEVFVAPRRRSAPAPAVRVDPSAPGLLATASVGGEPARGGAGAAALPAVAGLA